MLHFWTNNPPLLCPGFPRFPQEFSRLNRKYLKNLSRRAYARRFLLIYRDCPLRGFAEAPHMLRVFFENPANPRNKTPHFAGFLRDCAGFCGILRGFAVYFQKIWNSSKCLLHQGYAPQNPAFCGGFRVLSQNPATPAINPAFCGFLRGYLRRFLRGIPVDL